MDFGEFSKKKAVVKVTTTTSLQTSFHEQTDRANMMADGGVSSKTKIDRRGNIFFMILINFKSVF